MAKSTGSIEASIRTLRTDQTTRSEVSSAGDWAQTDYQVVATYKAMRRAQAGDSFDGYSLVACDIKTGRTHQIRVHLLHLGHPLVADDKYLAEDDLVEDRAWCPRLFLHCYRLGFRNIQNQPELVVCPLPEDLRMALVKLGAANIDAHASDLLFGETSWQRDLFRPPLLQWRPGTRVQRRISTLVGEAPEPVPLSQVGADRELRQILAEEGVPAIGRAWLARHCDVYEILPGAGGSELSVRLRPAHAAGDQSPEEVLERQLEAVRSELEELERQKQRAVAEEDYARAGEIKRRAEAARAELASLQELREEAFEDRPAEGTEELVTYAEERAREKAKRARERPAPELFTQDVRDEHMFPSLVSLTAKPVPKKPAANAAESAENAQPGENDDGSPQRGPSDSPSGRKEEGVLSLKDALVNFLQRRDHFVAHINEINNDRFIREVMAAQQPKPITAVNKTWLKQHEDVFAYLPTPDNDVYIALCKAVQSSSKSASGRQPGARAAAGATASEQPRPPAYHKVIQKTSGQGDPKPLVYQYSAAARSGSGEEAQKGGGGAAAWQEQFLAALRRSPQQSCRAEEVLAAVPLFAEAMGARKAWEQKELLVMFLEGFPERFRVERRGSGTDKQYIICAR